MILSNRLKTLSLAAVVAGAALLAGCNDTLRQFIVPVPKPGGNPAPNSNAVILSTNPTGFGSDLHIDVSGDTIVGIVSVGTNPVFLGKTPSRAFVINGDNTVSSYIALLPLSSQVNTVTMPVTSVDLVAGGTSSGGNFYTTDMGSNDSSMISSAVLAVTQIVPVGTGPVAIAGNAANSKMYVINQGSNNVTVVSTTDNTVTSTIPVGAQPIWGVMSADGVDVFVVNQGDGTVSVIDTTLDIVIAIIPVGPSPNFAFYDPNRERVYVTNTGNNTVSVIKADGINLGVTPQILPVLLKNITVSGTPISVAAVNDGSKAYVALGNCPAGTNQLNLLANLASCNGNLLSVIDAQALLETKTITVGAGAVSVDVAGDASRAYVVSAHDTTTISDNVHAPNCTANCLPGTPLPNRTFSTPSVYIIQPSTDNIVTSPRDPSIVSRPIPSFFAPQQDLNCMATIDPNFNSIVPMPCAIQTSFMVRVFP
ncbi:MAG TPA: YncE family protein [Terriglobales bacterium]